MFYLHYSLLEKGILSTFVVFICVNQIVIEYRLIFCVPRYPHRYTIQEQCNRYRHYYIDVTFTVYIEYLCAITINRLSS